MDTQSATAQPAGLIARLRCAAGRLQRGLAHQAAGRHDLHHPRRQRGAGLFLADPAGALDGRLGLRRLCLCLDLGAAARQHDGFRHLGVGAEDHSGISHPRRARAAARLPLRQPLDDVRRFLAWSRCCWRAWSKALSPWIDANAIVPLYIGCLTLPAFVVANTQDGIARSHDWMRLGLMPQFIVRQSLIIGLTAGAFVLGFHLGATAAMLASAAAVWIAMIGQMIVLNRRLGGHIEPGPKAYDFRGWLAVSLPILLVESFYLLLSYTDVLVLQQFRSSEEVGVYFAVVKTLALVSFIHYAMSATTAHRFAEYHALGDKAAAVGLCRARDPVDVLAVARRHHPAAGAGQAAAVAVRAAIRGRLRHHVHRRDRPRGALRDRPGRAAAQHARPSAHLRAGLCAGLRHERRAVRRCWCRASAAMAPRPRPRSRWCSRPCCCSGSCAGGSACTCWRSGSAASSLHRHARA